MSTEENKPAGEPVSPPARLWAAVRDGWDDTSAHPPGGEPKSANELAEMRTDLALERNLMAADRSLMAWVRTALSMISFGFTIYKLLQGFQSQGAHVADASPRAMGLFLVGLGTVAMLMGLFEYRYRLNALRRAGHFKRLQPSFVMALIMSVTGLVLFVGIVSKLL